MITTQNRKRITLLFLGIVISLIAFGILFFETSKYSESTKAYSQDSIQSTLSQQLEAKNWEILPLKNTSNTFHYSVFPHESVRISVGLIVQLFKIKSSN